MAETKHPRTEHVIEQCVTRAPMTTAIDPKAVAMAELLVTPNVRDHLARLIDHAFTLETQLTTWQTLPPREHFNMTDCYKAVAWRLKLIRVQLDEIEKIQQRAKELSDADAKVVQQLRDLPQPAGDGVTGD